MRVFSINNIKNSIWLTRNRDYCTKILKILLSVKKQITYIKSCRIYLDDFKK